MTNAFWSSVELTGNPTAPIATPFTLWFWSSVELTGNPTERAARAAGAVFWSSVELTGNPTQGELMLKRGLKYQVKEKANGKMLLEVVPNE